MWQLFKYFDLENKGFINQNDIEEILAREGIKMAKEVLFINNFRIQIA